MILTPGQVDWYESLARRNGNRTVWAVGELEAIFDTLRAHAEIVQRVAEMEKTEMCGPVTGECPFCHAFPVPGWDEEWANHAPDCLYLQARKLREM